MGGTIDDMPKVPPKPIIVKKIKLTTRKRGLKGPRNDVSSRPIKPSAAITRSRKSNHGRHPHQIGEATARTTAKTSSFGLPTFQYKAAFATTTTTTTAAQSCRRSHEIGDGSSPTRENDDSSSFYPQNTNDAQEEYEIPSDTLTAINSLIQSDQGLHMPIANNGSVQVILESQIYSIFDENHASNVNFELLELIRNNTVRRIYCQNMSLMAIMRTTDYVKAVWDSYSHESEPSSSTAKMKKLGCSSEEIISWFLSQLHHWTEMRITEYSLEDQWEKHNNNSTENRNDTDGGVDGTAQVVQYLLNAQFLIRDPRQNISGGGKEESYFLWLPKWGIVLKTWNGARKQLLTLLAQRKEMSKANVLQKNRHSMISTNFLLNELLSEEKICVVERPFGTFVQLIKHS
mmetsp:Transcript_1839/g.4398  ORF Transcript_1839/g.4398 Transcript_1839/m.4398 type:complete len:402 (-) Transcript_1839:165-1370(-)|eukprot:CAMPEP_0201153064 /NCGR_PEP_ID=MMETSP0851-20130426/13597_1 /ASSEMBLY_ACC=CAM_ASM_000631 /TAXON_ID=183588 /ORGANISM="Pseudo-nitzschia fraudulenta, Strain WWA7" /LENGTH=401 /DNA_ID=CAMNT_0047430207 /DNA_START=178 /DNA_END=1383 /DNA_ORIENTATION=+